MRGPAEGLVSEVRGADMMRRLDTKVGKFVIRNSIPRGSKISGGMTILEKIEWMKEHNPNARLIPFSLTYYKAVSELNLVSKGTTVRPEVPEWFCGHVNKEWPYFEDDVGQDDGGNDFFGQKRADGSGDGNDKYPWDKCCELGYEPNTPGYMWCEEAVDRTAVNEDESFLSDFSIGEVYDEAEWPESIAAASEECFEKEGMPSKSGEWSCGGWGGGSIGAAGVKISSASISGRSKITWGYSKGKSIVDGWGVSNALICVGLKAGGKWYSGKVDWVKTGQTTKSLENIKCGYNGWTAGVLKKATEAKMCVCHNSKKVCSNWCKASI